jgi:phage-related protein
MEAEFLFDTVKYLEKIKPEKAIKKIKSNLERLLANGHQKLMGSQMVKKMQTNCELFELRTIFNDILYRLLFVIREDKYLFVLGFDKKVGEKTPNKHIETAVNRVKLL